MASYEFSWITENLAMGHAPMSYDDLDSIRKQGIGAIINLCAEFCDLHEIEGNHGFEVYYLPVFDDEAPPESELERALEWLDEAIYLGKKVLVHCRYGVGRTATFVAAYLLRKGFGLKVAKKKVQKARAMTSSFPQWRLLRKYSKKSGKLTVREPSLESKRIVDLGPFFRDYEALLRWVDELFDESAANNRNLTSCGSETDECCYEHVELSLAEAAYLSHHMNRTLPLPERRSAIDRAVQVARRVNEIRRAQETTEGCPANDHHKLKEAYRASRTLCPLSIDAKCEVYAYRPIACRIFGLAGKQWEGEMVPEQSGLVEKDRAAQTLDGQVRDTLTRISANMLYALSSLFLEQEALTFSLADAVSGRFIQAFFDFHSRLQDAGPVSDTRV